jgi:hypothetical protein
MSSVRALTAVFQREVLERRLLLAAALLLGLVPLLVPILPRFGSGSLSDVRGATALALALTFGGVVAVMLGGSVIARDLAERRISFYFSRPLPGWTIWAGKLAAGAALAVGGAALVLVPALLMGDKLDPSGYWGHNVADSAESFFLAAAALLFLLLVGHATGVILRSRSPWLILDLVALLVTGWLILDSGSVLVNVGAGTAALVLSLGVALLVPLALLVAGAVQVIRGRTDVRRSHRLLSLTLWGFLLPLGLLALGGSRWVIAATPRDLAKINVALSAPVGDWVFLQGYAAHRGDYEPTFLVDTSNGKFIQLTPYPWGRMWWLRSSFSADGRRVAWTTPGRGSVSISTADLSRPDADMVQTPISFNSYLEDLALSPDGRSLATVAGGRLQIDEFPGGRMLASVALPGQRPAMVRLVFGERAIRIYAQRNGLAPGKWDRTKNVSVLDIYEYDLAAKELVRTGEIDFRAMAWDLSNNDDVGRLVLRNQVTESVQVHDARTGELRLAYPVPRSSSVRAALLTGDRLALAIDRDKRSELHIIAGDGALLRRQPFDSGLTVGGQPTPESLVLWTTAGKPPGTSWLYDLGSGKLKRISDGLAPVISGHANQPGSTGTKLFVGQKGRLLWIDPQTGRQRVVLPGQ